MRLVTLISAALLILLQPLPLTAQEKTSDSELHPVLTKLEKDSWEAVKKRDGEFFRTFMAPEFIGFFADGTQSDRAAFIRNLDEFELDSFEMGKTSLLRVNENAAMITYRVAYFGKHKGKPVRFSGIESSSLYVKRDGKWLEIFYQETQGKTP